MKWRDNMLKRYHQLDAEYNEFQTFLRPLQDELENLVGQGKDSESVRKEIVKKREGLYEVEMERAALARALKTLD